MTAATSEPLVTTTPPPSGTGEPASTPFFTVIEPSVGWQAINVKELWRYRELLLHLAWRDIKVRYKQTALGAAWAILQPAMMMAVFTVFFGRLAGVSTGGIPQPLFFLTGILPWFYFANSLSNVAASVVGSERLITKIYFPRLIVPFGKVAATTADFFVACSLLAFTAVVYIFSGYSITPGWHLALFPLVVLLIILMATGLGTMLAALNVRYRDVQYVVPFFVQLGMFATPTIYMRPKGDETGFVLWLLKINPMTSIVETFRVATIGGDVPWGGLAYAAIAATTIFFLGCFYFRATEDQFADVI